MESETTELEKQALYAENRNRLKRLQQAFYNGQPFEGASYFVWDGSLYYGLKPEVKTKRELRGIYIEIASSEETLNAKGNARALRRICSILNAPHADALARERKAGA